MNNCIYLQPYTGNPS